MIDLEAVKQKLRGLVSADTPSFWSALKQGGHLLIPVAILLYQLVIQGASIQRAGLNSIVAVVIVSWFRKNTRMGFHRIVRGLEEGATSSIGIAAVCACAGIIVGVVSTTGLGVKFSSVVVALAQGNLFLTLLFTAIICMFLGMGVPTTAAYIIAAAVGVPALLKLGANPLAAHLFVFYFACISAITPPVCGAVYTACGFSGTSVIQTGWTATRLGISAYIVPFLFVYHPVIMLKGPFWEIVQATVTAIIAVASVSMAVIGTSYFGNIRWNVFQRVLFFAAFIGLIIPGTDTDLMGIGVMAIGIFTHPLPRKSIMNLLVNRKKGVAVKGN